MAVVVGAALLGGACGSKSSGSSDTTTTAASSSSGGQSGGDAQVTIKGFAFQTTSVKAGSTVKAANQDSTTHTVTADKGEFDTTVSSNGSKTFTAPSAPGSYGFHCNIHTSMKGTLTVT